MEEKIKEGLSGFLEVLGLTEEPFGLFYTDQAPQGGFSPKAGSLPTAEAEARGEVNWGETEGRPGRLGPLGP